MGWEDLTHFAFSYAPDTKMLFNPVIAFFIWLAENSFVLQSYVLQIAMENSYVLQSCNFYGAEW